MQPEFLPITIHAKPHNAFRDVMSWLRGGYAGCPAPSRRFLATAETLSSPMEPVSFAVGIIGLAGLFSTCLDVLEKVDSWKDFGSDSRSLSAQLKAHRLRLERWDKAVGLENL
ncbi:hypothetical protein N7520_003580 [Penicillium odoratum]|uniref:uncharacterized protein n=1 Tax=Penicillium odoratum TaxID=1167516 RepID=UPI002549894B|nr:uncharacterized protein N7520_003580 [Penicillium odoratum]KAJ5769021.1 hypothetical protein N7520_003580 [Penicillium odoratum]